METTTFDRVKSCIEEVLVTEEGAITPTAALGIDLNADSLDVVEIIMALEDEFKIEIPDSADEDYSTLTVQQVVDRVDELLKANQA